MAKNSKGILSIEIGSGVRTFATIEEVQKWESSERAFFSFLENASRRDSQSQPAWSSTQSWLNDFRNFVQNYPNAKDNPPQLEKVTYTLTSVLERFVKQRAKMISYWG